MDVNYIYVKSWEEVPEDYTGIAQMITVNDNIQDYVQAHFLNGKFHREDGPALADEIGLLEIWCLNGLAYASFEEYFENLSEEQKLKFVWELNKWTK